MGGKSIVRRIGELVGLAGGNLSVHGGSGPETSYNNLRAWSGANRLVSRRPAVTYGVRRGTYQATLTHASNSLTHPALLRALLVLASNLIHVHANLRASETQYLSLKNA